MTNLIVAAICTIATFVVMDVRRSIRHKRYEREFYEHLDNIYNGERK